MQPLLVRRSQTMADGYEIIAGERRWRAAQRARLHEVPCWCATSAIAKRSNWRWWRTSSARICSRWKRRAGISSLIEEFRYTQEQLAERVGKSRSHVANMIRLLGLPEAVKLLLDDGRITAGHARALLGAKDPEALAQEVLRLDLSVRQTERAVQSQQPGAAKDARPAPRDPNVVALEHEMTTILGLKVAIHTDGSARGSVTIRYRSLDQLDGVLAKLKRT